MWREEAWWGAVVCVVHCWRCHVMQSGVARGVRRAACAHTVVVPWHGMAHRGVREVQRGAACVRCGTVWSHAAWWNLAGQILAHFLCLGVALRGRVFGG